MNFFLFRNFTSASSLWCSAFVCPILLYVVESPAEGGVGANNQDNTVWPFHSSIALAENVCTRIPLLLPLILPFRNFFLPFPFSSYLAFTKSAVRKSSDPSFFLGALLCIQALLTASSPASFAAFFSASFFISAFLVIFSASVTLSFTFWSSGRPSCQFHKKVIAHPVG